MSAPESKSPIEAGNPLPSDEGPPEAPSECKTEGTPLPEIPANTALSALSSIHEGLTNIQGSLDDLNKKFEKRILANNYQEKIIDGLHAELQTHKSGVIRQLLSPILNDLVRLYDQLCASVRDLPCAQNLTLEQAVQSIATFPSDVNYILERQGLEMFEAKSGEPFDPARHRVANRVQTDNPLADKTIAESIRPGFIWEGKVFRPNGVSIFTYTQPATASEPQQTSTPAS